MTIDDFDYDDISIHALRKESDDLTIDDFDYDDISIHALRKESDGYAALEGSLMAYFNPRSP